MKFVPASLGGRLLLVAALATAVAVIVAALLIGVLLRHFITVQVDQRLDTQLAAVADTLEVDASGALALAHIVDGPPFDRLGSGWYWHATGPNVDIRSSSLGSGTLERPPMRFDWGRIFGGPPPGADITAASGEGLHVRAITRIIGSRSVTIVASAPQAAIDGPLRGALVPLVVALAALWAALTVASIVQVRLGLRPLRRLQAEIGAIRAGRATHVARSQPSELAPLAAELNGLIDQNAENLANARRNVANLAHGIKTPLATLSLEVQNGARDGDGSLEHLVDQIERRVRHHLGRARSAATTHAARSVTQLAPHIEDLAAALTKIYADRGIALSLSIEPGAAVAADAEDVDEMIGNLLDNAFKWARSRIQLAVTSPSARIIVIAIQDDGPGLARDLIDEMILPGRRADESVPGHGFGLSISRELAELNGGALSLGPAGLGGLQARLELPAAPQ